MPHLYLVNVKNCLHGGKCATFFNLSIEKFAGLKDFVSTHMTSPINNLALRTLINKL